MRREQHNGTVHTDELVRIYQEAVEWEDVRPGEHVRTAVLAAAQQKAVQRRANQRNGQSETATGTMPQAQKREAANDARWKIRALGSLAALGLVGLLVSRFLPGTDGYTELAQTLPSAPYQQARQEPLVSASEEAPVAAAAEPVVPAESRDAEAVLAEAPIQSATAQANKPVAPQVRPHKPQSMPPQSGGANPDKPKARDDSRPDRESVAAQRTGRQTKQSAPVVEKQTRITQTEPAVTGRSASRTHASPFPGDVAERAPAGFGQIAPAQIGAAPAVPDAGYPGDVHAMKPAPLARAPYTGRTDDIAPMPQMPQSASRAQAVSPHGVPRPVMPETVPALRARKHDESLPAEIGEVHAAMPDNRGKTAHHQDAGVLLAAAKRGDLARVRHMLQAGVFVDTRDASGRTALMHAAARGHLAVVRYLLQQQADAGLVDHTGRTAATHARLGGYEEIVREISGKP